jgi:hypothetical protein
VDSGSPDPCEEVERIGSSLFSLAG